MWRYFMNSMQLKDKLRNISKEKNVDFNTLLRLYMYDRFVERLSKSARVYIEDVWIDSVDDVYDITFKYFYF